MLDEGWLAIYIDDILIFSSDITEHHNRTRRVLQRLQDNDLFLNPKKCEFDVETVEFLGSIIQPDEVTMDPTKLSAILEWDPPKTVKQVQSFLGFGNFYRRFIRNYSTIVRPRTELTKKGQDFNWTNKCEEAFQYLKKRFTEAPILRMPDPTEPFQIECDTSKVATGAVLRQKGPDGLWHPCAYLSKSFTEAERNYQIYDRELLAIIRALEAWRHFLQGSPHPIEILTDHKNLTYFKSAQKVNRRQARWKIFLDSFNYKLKYNPGKELVQADALSRRPDHDRGENDNQDVILLKEEVFAKAVNVELQERIRSNKARDPQLIDLLTSKGKIQQRPGFGKPEDWTDDEGILLYKDRVYVPPDDDLRRDIVKMHHEPIHMAHPGIQKTKDLVKRDYYWDGMSQFISNYVQGCATCQTTKVRTNPTKAPLMPIPHSGNTVPFQVITMDYITDLPPTEDGYDAIQVVVDHDVSKAAVYSPCTKQITAMGAAKLLWKDTFSRYGLPQKIISDRGPQFAAQAFRELHEVLGIQTSLSTAYHPQTDGQTERVNQEIDLDLRIYCANNPDKWADFLPAWEFAHNQRIHSSTGKSPFELLYGYQPRGIGTVRTNIKHPSTEERLTELRHDRENTIASHAQAAMAMARYSAAAPVNFKKGDKVLLESTNLKLPYPYRKLAPKWEGPFTITEVLGPVTFKLGLPKKWKIHPVFHAALLTPYRTTKEHGPDLPRPPPDIVEGEPEHEVEAIINHRRTGRNKRLQYLVSWKGWESFENSWEPASNLKNAPKILKAYKKKHKLK